MTNSTPEQPQEIAIPITYGAGPPAPVSVQDFINLVADSVLEKLGDKS